MADSNHSRRTDYTDFSQNDPFAELTRIMGHDPRAGEPSPAATSSEVADEFDIDLEKELMGELDFAEFDEPEQAESHEAEPADWREEIAARPAGQADAADEPEFEVDHSVEDLAASIMDTFEADEAELHPEREPEAAHAADAPATMRSVDMDEPPLDELLERELTGWDAPEPEASAPMVAEVEEEPLDALDAVDHAPIESVAADEVADFDLSSFEPVEQTLRDDDAVAFSAEPAIPADQPSRADFVDVASGASLEDELTALLSAGDEAIQAERARYQSEPEPVPATEVPSAYDAEPAVDPEPEEEWRPAVNTFGRANFVAARPAQVEQQAEAAPFEPESTDADFEPVDFAAVPDWDDPEELSALDADAAEPVMPSSLPSDEHQSEPAAEEDVFTSIFSQALAQEDAHGAPGSTTAELDEVLSHFSVSVPREQVAGASATSWSQAPAAVREETPDIETIDIAEAAYAVSDDLDIPNIDYGPAAPQAASFDDFEGDFAHAFAETGNGHVDYNAQPAGQAASWDRAAPLAQPAYQEMHATGAASTADAYALGEGEWQADQIGLDDDFAFDDEFEQLLANSDEDGEGAVEQPRRSSRGLVIAAVAAGVAVFGGIGVLGMSLLGGGSDTPAVVRADTDPMKVRPENPGGTVVPNQNSEAYNRVSGGANESTPEQERLITTTEEPVDIAAETTLPALPSGILDGEDELALAETDPAETSAAAAQPKSEDRIEPAADEPEGVGASGDLLAVTPRKVRTMIVRPDGTMVPREAPAAQEETVVAAAPLAAPALAPATSLAAPEQVAEDAGPTVDTPASVGVVPSQRNEPQPVPAPVAPAPVAAQPAPQPVTQTPAATPVSAPAAAAPAAAASSEWSMQIASQPTAESAQATYQDLARRYGNVLEGKGVNIVRADIAGKGVYYRVRIPASNRDEAIRLCTQYKSAGGSCFVSR